VATSTSPNALAAATAVIPEVGALDIHLDDEGLRVGWPPREMGQETAA
jgi:sugar-phosphatase